SNTVVREAIRCYFSFNVGGGLPMSTLSQVGRVCPLVLALAFPGLFLNAQQKAQPANGVKIGFLMDSLKVERWQTDLDRFQKRAAELGANVRSEERRVGKEGRGWGWREEEEEE